MKSLEVTPLGMMGSRHPQSITWRFSVSFSLLSLHVALLLGLHALAARDGFQEREASSFQAQVQQERASLPPRGSSQVRG